MEEKIKASIAKSIVRKMFVEARYRFHDFENEAVLQKLTSRLDKNYVSHIEDIRNHRNSFIVIGKQRVPHLIQFYFKKIDKEKIKYFDKVWGEIKILLVIPSEPYFLMSTMNNFLRYKTLYPLDRFFKIDKEIIKKYSMFVKKLK